jgi:hypothetical protein
MASKVRVHADLFLIEWLGEKVLPIHQGDFVGLAGGKVGPILRELVRRVSENLAGEEDEETVSFVVRLEVSTWLESSGSSKQRGPQPPNKPQTMRQP